MEENAQIRHEIPIFSQEHSIYFVDGKEENFESFKLSMDGKKGRAIILADADGTINHQYFNDLEDYFGAANQMRLRESYDYEIHMQNYAKDNGVVDYYNRTGEVLQSYIDYEQEYYNKTLGKDASSRFPFIIGDFCNGGPSNVTGFYSPVMPLTWNNRVSQFFPVRLFTMTHLYDSAFYFDHMFSLWFTFGWQNTCIGGTIADNRTTSLIHY